jgi:Flp pilus assembly protein TadD
MLLDTLGWVLHQAGKSKEGLAVLMEAVAKGPAFPSIHYHLGVVHQALGDDRLARVEFDKALALSADFGDAEDARKRRAALH